MTRQAQPRCLGPLRSSPMTLIDRTHPVAFVQDSLTSLGRIHVDTEEDGVVWLTGGARSREASDSAVSIARRTEHLTSVPGDLVIRHDD